MPSERLGDAQLVQEHLGSLVGVGELHPGDKASRGVAVVGDEQMVVWLVEEPASRVGLGVIVKEHAGLLDLRVSARAKAFDAHV